MKLKTVYNLPIKNIQDAKKYRLIKGIAMSEGETLRGEATTRDNIIQGAGALRASALQGLGKISINHGIDSVGRVLDAQHVTNEIDGKNIEQVEFIGTVDKDTYQRVENNEFAGCSTEDYARDKHCDNTCKITGRAFLGNSLITKDKKPNSLHTHVSVITEADILISFKMNWLKKNKRVQNQNQIKRTLLKTLQIRKLWTLLKSLIKN